MKKVNLLNCSQFINEVENGKTIVIGGFVGSCCPETLTKSLEKNFIENGYPRDLTLFHTAGQGNGKGKAVEHFAHEGMVKRVIGGHWNLAPQLGKLVLDEKIEGYNFPQGTLSQLLRDIAAKKIGTITHVGINTFVDPRIEGGKLNKITKENLVEVVNICGEEKLLYKSINLDIALLRGTYADEKGNISLEKEVATLDLLSAAQAVKNCGGKVFVQVERIVKSDTLDPRLVKIPHIYVDGVIVSQKEEHEQCIGCDYDPTFTGELRGPTGNIDPIPLDGKKIIARRSIMEIEKNSIVNLGIGIPAYIGNVASEEGIQDYMTLTVESGTIGGVPQEGGKFGASSNCDCILDMGYQFDFYDGGGLDYAFLGLAQVDRKGNLNVSKFGHRIAGCGGFINITQNAKKVFFCGTFTAKGLKTKVVDGKLVILEEGQHKKFVQDVQQITFSGEYAMKTKQQVIYITERAVFELREDGIYLIEVAPGIDIQTQIINLMDFEPKIDENIKLMDLRIFKDEIMNLQKEAQIDQEVLEL